MPGTAIREEEARNADAIAALAEETHQPLPVIKQVYEKEYTRLRARARVPDCLVLFASRRTRDALLHRST